MNDRSATTSDGRSSMPVCAASDLRGQVAHVHPSTSTSPAHRRELRGELPVADVDARSRGGAALEQHLAEAAGRCAGVEREPARRVTAKASSAAMSLCAARLT